MTLMTTEPATNRFNDLKHMIGNTPLLEIRFRFRGTERMLYAKAEHINMTGSIKDRMAFHILRSAYAEGKIRPDDTIVEATSGNTGIAFSAIGRALGHRVVIYIPNWMSAERIALIRSFGAEVVLVTREQGGFIGSIKMTEELAERERTCFLPRQFSNGANVEAHEISTGPEIWSQMRQNGIVPDAFVAGVGTGGTIMGVGRFLKRQLPEIRLHAVEPAESPTLSTGCKVGHHRIQGVSDEFIPAILQLNQLDPVISVHDGDAILMAQKLATQLGLTVGISSGANFIAALHAQELMHPRSVVATVFSDDNKKYLSTDLLREEPVRDHYLAPEVELLSYRAFGRVCGTCFQ